MKQLKLIRLLHLGQSLESSDIKVLWNNTSAWYLHILIDLGNHRIGGLQCVKAVSRSKQERVVCKAQGPVPLQERAVVA